MKEKPRSLRWELLLDLSLLTFCALILSGGFLILLLRVSFPNQIEKLVQSHLESVHTQFTSSDRFKELEKAGFDETTLLKELFDEFKKSSETSDEIELSFAFGQIEAPEFRTSTKSYLFFVPAMSAVNYQAPLGGNVIMTYSLSLDPFHSMLSRYKYIVFLSAILITLVLVLLGYQLLFRKNILLPLKNLSETANSFLHEDWNVRATVQRRDELGQIAEVLNEMARKIQEKEKKLVLSIQSLQKANEEIEASKNEQLQIEKLASVGRLAAGVAHEVGNPLGAISGYIDILRSVLKEQPNISPQDIELCDRIEAETNRISKIIRALLQQARPPQDRIRPVKLEPLLKRSVELAQIPPEISIKYDLEEDADVLCEQDQLIQVILNLLINARHAIEARKDPNHRGEIKLRLVSRKLPIFQDSGSQADLSLDTSVVRNLKPQTYWVLSIIDNGVGISAEDQNKLFEPFFSTKAPGKGTGLGLYVAKSIIESFRGTIVVQSAEGYGASFSILLPKNLS